MTRAVAISLCLLAAWNGPPDPPVGSVDVPPATGSAPNSQAPTPGPRVVVETIEGQSIAATLDSIDASGTLRLLTAGKNESLPLDAVADITLLSASPPLAEQAPSRIYLADGSVLDVRLGDTDAGGAAKFDFALRFIAPDLKPSEFTLPIKQILALRFAGAVPELEAEFQSRRAAAAVGRDLLIAWNEPPGPSAGENKKPIAVPGALEALSSKQWSFRIGPRLQTAPIDKAYAVVFGNQPLPAPHPTSDIPHPTSKTPGPGVSVPPAFASVSLASGGILVGAVARADSTILHLHSAVLNEISVPWARIVRVSIASPRIVYLSDLQPVDTIQRSIFDDPWPPQSNRSVVGGPLTIGGRNFEKGIGVHAFAAIAYELNGQFVRFIATVGIDDVAGPRASAVFRVRLDDTLAFESPVVRPGQALPISLDVTSARRMTLEADPTEDLELSDHCDWAAARLLRAPPSADATSAND